MGTQGKQPAGRAQPSWGAVAGAGAVAGWLAHDFAIFAVSDEPVLFLKLLPGGLLLLAAAAALGWVCARFPAALALLALASLVGALLPHVWEPPVDRVFYFLPKAVLLLALAAAVGSQARRRLGWAGAGVPSAAFGALGAAALFFSRLGPSSPGGAGAYLRVEAAVGAVALAALVLSRLPAARPRRVALAFLGVVALVAAAGAVRSALTLPPDTTPAERATAPADARNLVVIVLDTVAAKHLAPYGYARETTPRIDRFARERATLYRQARSVSSWTLPAHASLFTGLVPSRHGTTHLRIELPEGSPLRDFPALPLRRDVPTLAGILARQGWDTGAVIGNSPFVSRKFGLDRGFEHFDDRDGAHLPARFALVQLFGAHPGIGYMSYRRAETISDLALDWLGRRRDRPFFLFLNYMDAHYPYVAPAPFDRAFDLPRSRDPLHFDFASFPLLYDRELRGLDAQVGRVLERLERDGRLEDTAIVITADHGEVFGERGLYFHNLTLYDDVTRVPLYVHDPAVPGGRTIDDPVTTVDLFGMALDLAGLPAERRPPASPAASDGSWIWVGAWYRDDSLARKLEDPDAYRRDLLAWVDGRRKAIVDSRGRVELYDLEADPWETEDLAQRADPAEIAALVERARRWWEAHPPPEAVPGTAMDPATLDRLRTLGYVD